MELTLIAIGFIVLVILMIKQREEINQLRKGLSKTFDQLIHIKSLLEDSKEEKEDTTAIAPSLPVDVDIPLLETTVPEKESPAQPAAVRQKLSWFARFKRDHPDMEKFIGENLINKIGIIILVLGISFFVKYAIDKEWINEPARVGIGILCGGILLGVAHRLRLLYKAFSSVLVAGATAVFYFTIGIAFHDYGLFHQTTAFILMILITVFSVFVSVAYDRQELGILAVIGGFSVPFMVSTGDGNYHVLFTYLAILNVGMLTISYFKRWFIVNFTAFALTTILFAGWYIAEQADAAPHVFYHGFIYCTVFYFLFSIAFVLNNIVHKNKFAGYEIAALITNAAVYYAVGHHVFDTTLPQYIGLFTILLGTYNIIFAFVIYKKYQFDRNIIYVLIGLALTLATITIPVQFKGNFITIFWACEAVLLFWLTKKSQLRGFTFAGIVVQWLAIISLVMDLFAYVEGTVAHRIGINMVFLTGIMVIGSLVATYRLFKYYDYKYKLLRIVLNPIVYRKLTLNIAIAFGYIIPLIEISYQADSFFVNEGTIYGFIYLYHILYTTALLVLGRKETPGYMKWSNIVVVFNMLCYIVAAYRIPLMEKEHVFYNELSTFPYAMLLHYLALASLVYQVWLFAKASLADTALMQFKKPFTPWFIAFFVVYACSAEMNIGFLFGADNWDNYFQTKNMVIKVIFPILWGILSFVFLIFGIRSKMKIARIVALTLLGLTILKLFLYDIRDVSETGKIIAFILLGILILVISFVYQKIKKLIVDHHEEDAE